MNTQPNLNDFSSRWGVFQVTHWSIVQRAGDSSSPEAHAALEALCRAYWQPLYCFIRRRGYKEQEAQDLTQAFFERLLEKNYLAAVDRRKGKFRNFLLASLEHFLANEWRRGSAQKRGGGVTFVSFDETFDQSFADDGGDADRIFEQQWAMAVLNQVLSRLQEEFVQEHSAAYFEDIKSALTFEPTDDTYAQIAARHNTTADAIKTRIGRLRKRYGELLIAELSNTVSSAEELKDELRALFAAVS